MKKQRLVTILIHVLLRGNKSLITGIQARKINGNNNLIDGLLAGIQSIGKIKKNNHPVNNL